MKKSRFLLLLIAGIAGAGGGWLFTESVLKNDAQAVPAPSPTAVALVGETRPDFSLGSTDGSIITAEDFDGQVLLLNFWATWCKPCREEMPMLSELHERLSVRGFTVLGIALDDVAQARAFVEELNIHYPNAVGGADVMAVGVLYGNRAGLLPYSVLVDRDGKVAWTSLGELKVEELNRIIEEIL